MSSPPVLFWGNKQKFPEFSNWYKSEFILNGIKFVNVEQAMMYQKAKLFGDEAIATKILACTNPMLIKGMGRKVAKFDPKIWDKMKYKIVYDACFAKFTQDLKLTDLLLSTGCCPIAEASPKDRIWGIGIAADHPDASDPSKWDQHGQNLLGKAIMEVRHNIRLIVKQAVEKEL